MVHHLIKPAGRRRLFKVLWAEKPSGSISELARLARTSFAFTYRELRAWEQGGLVSSQRVGSSVIFAANLGHPQAPLLSQLLSAESNQPRPEEELPLLSEVQALGAPLGGSEETEVPSAKEETLASALSLAHRHAPLARVLPYTLATLRPQIDFSKLEYLARRQGEHQTLGFLLDVAATITGDAELKRLARRQRDRRIKTERSFFTRKRGKYQQLLTKRHTPRLARKWKFRLNMGLDSFAAIFEKFGYDPA